MKFELEKLLTVKDTEKAKELIGKKVYFGECGYEINNEKRVSILRDIDFNELCVLPFCDEDVVWHRYIYPYEDEEPKKKLVPFTWEDRDILRGKWVKEKETKVEAFITCFCNSEINTDWIELSTLYISPKTLLESFEFLNGEPCGKEVEE